jgi:hypothetical protein
MSRLIAIAILLLAQDPPEELVTVRLVSVPKRGAGDARFDGKALFPDGVALQVRLFRVEERLTNGVLAPEVLDEINNDVPTVEGRRIAFAFPVKDPGSYRLSVEYRENLQEPDVLTAVKKSAPGKWTFDPFVWNDEFVGGLSPRLRDFDHQAEAAISLIRRFDAATASNQTWKDQYPGLDKELTGYLKKFDQAALDRIFPAAALELRGTMRNLKGNAEAILFGDDGKCRGSIDYRTQKATKTIHSEDFAFDTLIKDVEVAKKAVGREFLLWIIKDFRRGGARTVLSDAIRSEAQRPGIAPFVEALEGFKDLELTEKRVRGEGSAR